MLTLMVRVSDFWPQPAFGERRRFDYRTPDGALSCSSVWSADSAHGSVICEDFDAAGQWLSTWFVTYVADRGVVEWRDDYPLSGLRKRIFGARQEMVFVNGRELLWGGDVEIGASIWNAPQVDYGRSRAVLPPFKGLWSTGWQHVNFKALHPTFTTARGRTFRDVLEFENVQIWNGKPIGTTFRSARGIGPIEIAFVSPNKSGALIDSGPLGADYEAPVA